MVCCDGTWNSPEQYHVTNVVCTARAVRPTDGGGVSQVVFYDWGIGSYFARITGGAMGRGIDKNILDAYRFLVHNYAAGDEIYLFGFSRGAYTARSLAGLILHAGLLKKIHAELIPKAYQMYRRRARSDAPSAQEFRKAHSRTCSITFLGVWDTVGALGVPSGIVRRLGGARRYAFHDTTLSPIIRHACHAVAIDEKRVDFEPTLWRGPVGRDQTLRQRWFAGVHGDVGGGHADPGLSHTALAWMWSEAEERGLAFDGAYRRRTLRPNSLGRIHRSWSGIYRIKGRRVRTIGELPAELEDVDASVRERHRQDDGYRPKNLTAFLAKRPWPET